jgi:hypothetical protein
MVPSKSLVFAAGGGLGSAEALGPAAAVVIAAIAAIV